LDDRLKQPDEVSEAARAELERRRVEKEAEARLSSIVESSDDAIVSKDLEGVVKKLERGCGDAAVAQLSGGLSRDWNPDGLCIALVIPVSSLAT
jgi:PAS domain-containing protein